MSLLLPGKKKGREGGRQGIWGGPALSNEVLSRSKDCSDCFAAAKQVRSRYIAALARQLPA